MSQASPARAEHHRTSPLQNRVTPTGAIIATPARGAMYGNRGGCFHTPEQELTRRRWATSQWICCVLAFKGRRRTLMQPGLFTELFFLDEITALAAGHRPCFECRRDDATRFASRWAQALGCEGRMAAPEMDAVLHAERLEAGGAKRTYRHRLGGLPAGTFFLWPAGQAETAAVLAGFDDGEPACLGWSPEGYAPLAEAPEADGLVDVLTPPSIVAVLRQGYWPPLPARPPRR